MEKYESCIEIAEGTYWVGFYDKSSGLHCNPYLIIDNDEAVLIDSGSRPDFPTVMMKILMTGVLPSSIKALIYHHYDPDLCGSVPNFEAIIDHKDLKIISDKTNNMFIRHYGISSSFVSLDECNHKFEFTSGRLLQFINTPYSHSLGSFVTFDTKSKILFTSDIFGSYGKDWQLFLKLTTECISCKNEEDFFKCKNNKSYCPIPDILYFHKHIMTSQKALRYSLEQIMKIPISMIAPQHGSIISDSSDIKIILELLYNLKDVGIDRII
ncbi:MAG: MBL fold metallo-hydrolase [Desulfobacterales bacterium]|nr:MBL fold metallo-hydrolase [Desulfobacterales bacterium]